MISEAVVFAAWEMAEEREASREGREVEGGRRASRPRVASVVGGGAVLMLVRLEKEEGPPEREGARARERPRERGGTEVSEPWECARR